MLSTPLPTLSPPASLPSVSPGPLGDPADAGRRRLPMLVSQRAEAQERRRLEQELRQAAVSGGFVLHYQPRLCLRTGRITAAEALLRWPHRKRGAVPPAVFIPVAERTTLINVIGEWVLRTGCLEALSWPAATPAADAEPAETGAPVLAVNVSGRQIAGGVLLGQIAGALLESGLPPERLELDLTEEVLGSLSTDGLFALSALRDLGVGLALDDFGSFHASLQLLCRLPLTVLKLERSLIRSLPHDQEDAAIVRAASDIGRTLGMRIVAMGVETTAQRDFLADIGCAEGQGFLFSPAVPPETLRGRMASGGAPGGAAHGPDPDDHAPGRA